MQKSDVVAGALVADAAAMGLHWLYDQDQIKRIAATGDIIFRCPDAASYDGQKGYFAHRGRVAGEASHYGEAAELFVELLEQHEIYSTASHRQLFLERFGPGGSFVGYADRPTKALVAKILTEGDDIADASGSDDDQLPALAAVPAMFAFDQSREHLIQAVRVTADNPMAVDGSCAVFDCLQALAQGASLEQALHQAATDCKTDLSNLLLEGLAADSYDPLSVAQHFGLPCHIPQGLPIVWHMLAHGQDFETLLRDNVACGGDSCGRALALGAIAGFALGVPDDLLQRCL